MFIYAIATFPLIDHVGKLGIGTDVWYADDGSACAPLLDLKNWFNKLLHHGTSYGYYPEPKKCGLIVNQDNFLNASQLFSELGVKVSRVLGSFIGDQDSTEFCITERVNEWSLLVERLAFGC
jgi:hypothetical protein